MGDALRAPKSLSEYHTL